MPTALSLYKILTVYPYLSGSATCATYQGTPPYWEHFWAVPKVFPNWRFYCILYYVITVKPLLAEKTNCLNRGSSLVRRISFQVPHLGRFHCSARLKFVVPVENFFLRCTVYDQTTTEKQSCKRQIQWPINSWNSIHVTQLTH